jgi:hypothetical protein
MQTIAHYQSNTDILIQADSKPESHRKTIKHLELVSLYDAIAIDCIATLGVCTYAEFCKIPSMDLQRARRLTLRGYIKIQSKSGRARNNLPINHYVLTDKGMSKACDINAFCNRIRQIVESKQV